MLFTTADSLADLNLTLTWKKQGITHTDIYFADEANLYRDIFPKEMAGNLLNRSMGDKRSWSFKPGKLIPSHSDINVRAVRPSQCNLRHIPGHPPLPRAGRFYPKGILSGIAGVFSENITPFRVLDSNEQRVIVDFNHPLSDVPLDISIEILDIKPKKKERGGMCTDWIEQLTSGPGIQSRPVENPVDFFSDNPFFRNDEKPDASFYSNKRIISHIDETARRNLSELYGKRIERQSLVLDLMSSWQSHLPDDLVIKGLHGLGMNRDELAANPRLSEYRVHDLNLDPSLPYGEGAFDTVICSLSVEYLIRPFDVFKEVYRVLKPGGQFIVTFSNRWFPTKAIGLWAGLHEFERMGLVMEYYLASGFGDIETLSLRGYPRPYMDDYFPALKQSDPLYLVQGAKK
jgi:hypothetical protein